MKNTTIKISALALAVMAQNSLALESLDDQAMSGISGQSGIAIELNSGDISAGAVTYTQDDVSLVVNDLLISDETGDPTYITMDVEGDGDFVYRAELGATEFSADSIGMSSATQSAEFYGIRGRTQGYNAANETGLGIISIGDDGDGNIKVDGSQLGLFYDRLHFSDDGMEIIFDDLTLSAVVNYGRIINEADGLLFDFGTESNRGLELNFDVGAIAMGLDPNNPVGFDDAIPDAFGALSINMQAYGTMKLSGGGAVGEGITFIPGFTLVNDDSDVPAVKYVDDGFILLAENLTGVFSSSGMTFDFEEDDAGWPYMALRFQDLRINVDLQNFYMGGTEAEYLAGEMSPMGSFKGQLIFEDGYVDKVIDGVTTSVLQENYIHVYPGGNYGSQGINTTISWNMVSGDLRPVDEDGDGVTDYNMPSLDSTYIAMQDDGNWVFFNGFNGWMEGDISYDMTRQTDTTGLYLNPYDPSTGTFTDSLGYEGQYDGLRIEMSDLKGSYSFAGVSVGTSASEDPNDPDSAFNSPLMGGTELLLALEVFPAYDFTINGNITVEAGGLIGQNGLTLNSDIRVTDANAAMSVDEYGKGVWLTGVTYDFHTRDGGIDVTEDGLTISKGLSWSTLKVQDIRFGDKETGESLGTFTLERLEDGTTIAVASGGAGQVCIGGSLNAAGTGCSIVDDTNGDGVVDDQDAATGRFEDRGEEGLTIKVNFVFAEDDGSDPRYAGKGNSFSWTQPNGTTVALNNLSTSDGSADTNDYGLNVDLSVDVARTAVRDEDGNLVKLVNGDYEPFEEGDTIAENGPLGFAVFGRVHFKQLNIDGLTLAATPTSDPKTVINSMVIQNADIQANLTATPIR